MKIPRKTQSISMIGVEILVARQDKTRTIMPQNN